MSTIPPLSGAHLRTYERIFQHPLTHNLGWHEVEAMLGELGEASMAANGHLSFSRNGQTLVLHRPHSKDITDAREVMEIRHFLEKSAAEPVNAPVNSHVAVLLSRQSARVFHSDQHGSAGKAVRPHDAQGVHHSADSKDFSRGKSVPEPNPFFATLAIELKEAGRILLFGNGAGKGSEMELFVAWARHHDPKRAARIVGSVVVDEHHTSDGEILARTREFFAGLPNT